MVAIFFIGLAIYLMVALGFGIYFVTTHIRDCYEDFELEYFSVGQKIWLAIDVLVYFASVAGIIYIVSHPVPVGPAWFLVVYVSLPIILFLATAFIAAYTTSPLRTMQMPDKTLSGPGAGCATALVMPMIAIGVALSWVIILLAAWVFAIRAIVKK